MVFDNENIKWLKEAAYLDSRVIGRKAARLAQLNFVGVTVPRGFVLTSTEYFNFLQKNNIKQKISSILNSIDYTNKKDIKEKSKELQKLIHKGKINEKMEIEIYKYYSKIGETGVGWLSSQADTFVAIRCSVVCDDGDVCDTKFVEEEGGNVNVKGRPNLIKGIKEAWATLFSPSVLEYAHKKNISVERLGMCVLVQRMINAKYSGITLSSKSLKSPNIAVIEAIYGFGAAHVVKTITPDHYETQKKPYRSLSKTIAKQEWELKRVKGQSAKVKVLKSEQEKQKINTHLLKDLTQTALKVEEFFGTPQLIEWAMDKADIYVISSEAINPHVIEKTKKGVAQQKISSVKNMLLTKGIGVAPVVGSGIVVKVKEYGDLERITDESILVCERTDQEMIKEIKIAKGVITTGGGAISHAAIICKDLNKPCVVGAKDAFEKLENGSYVMVNGISGEINSVSKLDLVEFGEGSFPEPEELEEMIEGRIKQESEHWEVIRGKRPRAKKTIKKKEKKIPKEQTKLESKKEEDIDINSLDIKNLAKIDVLKTQNIVIPIDAIFSQKEREKLKNEFPGSVCVLAKNKIKKILDDIKAL